MSTLISHTRISRLAFVAISLLLVLSVFAVTLPQPVQAASVEATCAKTYTVKKGDTIRSIANQFGMKWRLLARNNDIKFPYTLDVGETLCINATATTTVNPKITATVSGFVITITGKSFPKTPQYVKAGLANKYQWYRLGTLTAKKDGTFTRSYLLPKALRNQTSISVCVKNAVTDSIICQSVAVR